jgi:hypothetical protein
MYVYTQVQKTLNIFCKSFFSDEKPWANPTTFEFRLEHFLYRRKIILH